MTTDSLIALMEARKTKGELTDFGAVRNAGIDDCIAIIRQHEAKPVIEVKEIPGASLVGFPSEISVVDDDLIEALMNEHDMDIPEDLLAAPYHPHFKAHRNGVKAMLHFLDKQGYKRPPEPVSVSLEKCVRALAEIDGKGHYPLGTLKESRWWVDTKAVLTAAGVECED